jgi:hypothetical protein
MLIVRFVLYSDKTVSQCMTALNERLQMSASANRPALGGWVEKGGRFSVTLSSVILGAFTRTTRLEGTVERENGGTVIRGSVPDGVPPKGQILIVSAVLLVGLLTIAQGTALFGIVAVLASIGFYITLRGDYENSDRLLMEVERTLKADPKPKRDASKKTVSATPKKPTAPAAKKTTTSKPAAGAAKKPVAMR